MEPFDFRIPTTNSSIRYAQSHRDIEAEKAAALEQCLRDKRLAEQLTSRSSVVVNVPRSSRRYNDLIPLGDVSSGHDTSPPTQASKKRGHSSTTSSSSSSSQVGAKERAGRASSAARSAEKSAADRHMTFFSPDLFPGSLYVPELNKQQQQQQQQQQQRNAPPALLATVAPPASNAFDMYRALHPT